MERKGKLTHGGSFCSEHQHRGSFSAVKSKSTDSEVLTESPNFTVDQDMDEILTTLLPSRSQSSLPPSSSIHYDNFAIDPHLMFDIDAAVQSPVLLNSSSSVPSSALPSLFTNPLPQISAPGVCKMTMPDVGSLTNPEASPGGIFPQDMTFEMELDPFSDPVNRPSITTTPPLTTISMTTTRTSLDAGPSDKNKFKLVLEDVQPDMVLGVMSMLVESKSNVKVKVSSNASE
jgi:hypothetical protein